MSARGPKTEKATEKVECAEAILSRVAIHLSPYHIFYIFF
jgi:hypothetical protein